MAISYADEVAKDWNEEDEAAQIVVGHLGGVATQRDPGGGSTPIHDFDVAVSAGQIVAVEVTRHTVPAEVEARAAVAGRDWKFPSLRYDWVIDMVGHYDVRVVHGRVPSLLEAVEAASLEAVQLGKDPPPGPASDALSALRALGARLLYRLSEATGGAGRIIVGAAPVAGSTATDIVVDVAEHHANLADNSAKLASASAQERHLFIWVESNHHQVVAAMGFEFLPERPPIIPEHIDTVWLATAFHPAQVWRYVRGEGWEDLDRWHFDSAFEILDLAPGPANVVARRP